MNILDPKTLGSGQKQWEYQDLCAAMLFYVIVDITHHHACFMMRKWLGETFFQLPSYAKPKRHLAR